MESPRVLFERDGRIARITLNRPDRLNAIDDAMPRELRDAVTRANADDAVHVVVLAGAGRAFCAGYDLALYAERRGPGSYTQEMPWDPTREGLAFKARAEEVGFKQAVRERDSGAPITGS